MAVVEIIRAYIKIKAYVLCPISRENG